MQSVNDYLAKVLSLKGGIYWNGCFFRTGTEQLWQEKSVQKETKAWFASHPGQKSVGIGKKCGDCCGVDKYARWVQPDGSVPYDADTDKDQDMLYNLAVANGRKHGTMATFPATQRGIILKTTGHMEISLGNGKTFGSRDSVSNVGEFDLNTKPWQVWYENPYLDYSEGVIELKKGDFGEQVGAWQKSLLKCGYKMINKDGVVCTVDNDFGTGTENGTNLFKSDEDIEQNGIVDEITYGRMMDRLRFMYDEQVSEGNQLSETYRNQVNEINTLKQSNSNLTAEKNALKSRVNSLELENGMLEADNAELDKKIASDKFKIDTIDQRERDHKEIVDNLNEQIAELKIK